MSSPEQRLKRMQSLIDPNEFAQAVVRQLERDSPSFCEWNGTSGVELVRLATVQVAIKFEERLDKYLDQHFRDMDLHRKSMLAEVRNFYDDFQRFALITGRRVPEFGNHYTTNNQQIKEQYATREDNNNADSIDS